jgi:hypothetical protein
MRIRLRVLAILAGIALVLVTNALVLGHVFLNRHDGPDSTLHMSERELALPYYWGITRENSGTSLRIRYSVPSGRASSFSGQMYVPFELDAGDADWLDDAHLAALGFDVNRLRRTATEERRGTPTSKEVLFVLEFDGPAYATAVERARRGRDEAVSISAANPGKEEFTRRAKAATDAADFAEHRASRLFVVDAGLNRDELRSKYPDRQRYAIVRGILEPVIGPGSTRRARVGQISIGEITVPYALRRQFEGMIPTTPTSRDERRDRFDATISWGQQLEPWLEGATLR